MMDQKYWVVNMAKCPYCRVEVHEPIKTWELRPKSRQAGGVIIGLYKCPSCGRYFRAKAE
jgi:uncharacterized Zn finger protein